MIAAYRTRKPRAQGSLVQLSAEQRQKLNAWLNDEGCTYKEAQARVFSEFGVKTSHSALSSYYSKTFLQATPAAVIRSVRSGENTIELELALRIEVRLADLIGAAAPESRP